MNHPMFSLIAILSWLTTSGNSCIATSPTTTVTTTDASVTTTPPTTTPPTTAVVTDCTTCTAALITLTQGTDGAVDATPVEGVDATGCATITYTCENTPVDAQNVIFLTFYGGGIDRGVDQGTGSLNVLLNCVDGAWVRGGLVIDEILCQVI
ncbi:C6 domain-containing protein [Caenorhabditis elegans]|uniref:C6 domain-containing protein n=1 Tax=Caenorhabditis elegans TaxID=6239 RepID=O18096_CAEEL|nr:C6 domain-containing protein [Caenorhabditis elegans]CAB03368.1 C6 domain-containing protein [Caenorhabditis elegans]|eukprot:NP_496666.1 Uncharacterized protein CELE_T21B4.3 [Caenorhabditis elegans]